MLSPKRVVITGMGVISPVGLDVPTAWRNLTAGNSGVRPITFFDAREFGVRFAGEPPGFDPLDYFPARMARRTDRFSQYALAALEEALAQSQIKLEKHDPYEIGVIVGAGVGGIRTYTQELNVLQEKGPRRVSPFL
ncbi:MAG TPA: beta-ketoacyl synthase N-terminal-like domain-containing protein, partial [Anaerolineales bacterium]|nr:beta-ketoacyl synthase N-terminal-like domain-containing protein [Anaerolineales bacterium]